MPKKSSHDYFNKAEERGSKEADHIVNDAIVHKTLEPDTEREYERLLRIWNDFIQINPEESAYELVSLKKFIRDVAWGMDGRGGNRVPGQETIRKLWNHFHSAWNRSHDLAISKEIANSVTQFIKGPLTIELKMPKTKRKRRFATQRVLYHLGFQLFAKDWFVYKSPSTRFEVWSLLLANAFSSSRIGEYIESSCRPGTSRGLYYKDVLFGVFINEHGDPEFAIQLTRDAKNMSYCPEDRPQHALYEGLNPGLLCFNPLLFYLSRLLEQNVFRDYATWDDLIQIMPPEGEMIQLRWRDDLLETPFFTGESREKIETADSYGKKLRALGLRAGYPDPARNHDFRREGLYWMTQFTSAAASLKYAGQTDPTIVTRHYLPQNCADGQQAYFGNSGRATVLNMFRGLTLPRDSTMSQSLPAEEEALLEQGPEFQELQSQIDKLAGATDTESVGIRKELYTERRRLKTQALRDWQKLQTGKYGDTPNWHSSVFDRARFMLPERDRLARSLFQVDKLRSATGYSALCDLMSLYRSHSEVMWRPGLEPENCHCPSFKDKSKITTAPSYDWNHVYRCHKKYCTNVYGFAELCFHCNEWIFDHVSWEQHCQQHIDNLETFPVWCDLLMYDAVLGTPGHCPFCLTDSKKSAAERMYQFLHRQKWTNHLRGHWMKLDDHKPQICPHPQPSCSQAFATIRKLSFHLQDCHGIPLLDERKILKRSRPDEDDDMPSRPKAQRLTPVKSESPAEIDYSFVNSTLETMNRSLTEGPKAWSDQVAVHIPLTDPSEIVTETDTFSTSDPTSEHETPATSVYSEEDNHLAMYSMNIKEQGHEHCLTESNQWDQGATLKVSPTLCAANFGVIDPRLRAEDSCQLAKDKISPNSDIEEKDDDIYGADYLIKSRRRNGRLQYLVKWSNYSEEESTWQDKKDVGSGLINDFLRRKKAGQRKFRASRSKSG